MRKLAVNPVPCTGCLNCQVVCAQARAGDQDRRASAIAVELDIFGGCHVHTVCRQCEEPQCVDACPQQAIGYDGKTGAWTIDREICVRCGSCVKACPFHAVQWWDDDHGPVKCDLCGGSPRCVQACHFDVIRFLEPEDTGFSSTGMPEDEQDPALGRGPEHGKRDRA